MVQLLIRIEKIGDSYVEAVTGKRIHGFAEIRIKTFRFSESSIEDVFLGKEAIIHNRAQKEFEKDVKLSQANGYEIVSSVGNPFPTVATVKYVNYPK